MTLLLFSAMILSNNKSDEIHTMGVGDLCESVCAKLQTELLSFLNNEQERRGE